MLTRPRSPEPQPSLGSPRLSSPGAQHAFSRLAFERHFNAPAARRTLLTSGAALQVRSTPQAFSHFSFEHTGGQALVVDIQGVHDLYTDPQIHTLDGCGYGDGNLGVRGMALFFRSHQHSALCKRLGLQEFARCAAALLLLCCCSAAARC